MTVRDTFVEVADGDQLDDGYFNGSLEVSKFIGSIYSGTSFNSTISQNSTGSNTANHTIQLSSSDLSNFNYLVINVTHNSICYSAVSTSSNRGSCEVDLKIETQDTGGSGFVTDFDKHMVRSDMGSSSGSSRNDNSTLNTIKLIHTLTDDEKSNGIDIKFTSLSSLTITGTITFAASFTNIQTWFRGLM